MELFVGGLLKLSLILFLSAAASLTCSGSTSFIIGGPGDPFTGDCAPFGCGVEYQQIYGASQFPGSIMITGLTFFNNNFVPGDIAPANYSVYLSTTTASVNGLDSTFVDNLGTDNTLFFTGALGGPIGPTNQFTIDGTPFAYNPSLGNLLLWITSDGDGLQFSAFLDFTSNAPAGTLSRAYSFDTSGVASILESDSGLVTMFTYDAATAESPEPATLSLAGLGLLGLMIIHRATRT